MAMEIIIIVVIPSFMEFCQTCCTYNRVQSLYKDELHNYIDNHILNSVNTFTPIERCAFIFVIAQVEKFLIGQKIQKLQNHARCNSSLIGQ